MLQHDCSTLHIHHHVSSFCGQTEREKQYIDIGDLCEFICIEGKKFAFTSTAWMFVKLQHSSHYCPRMTCSKQMLFNVKYG